MEENGVLTLCYISMKDYSWHDCLSPFQPGTNKIRENLLQNLFVRVLDWIFILVFFSKKLDKKSKKLKSQNFFQSVMTR